MDKKAQYDKRLEPFIGNEPNHIGYSKSFKAADFLMSTERLTAIMESFSKHIQETTESNKQEEV